MYSIFNQPATRLLPSRWDMLALLVVLSLVLVIGWASSHFGGAVNYTDISTLTPYQQIPVSLWELPLYAAETTVRMFIALFFSLLCSFIFGAWAAKSARAERLIIPAIDILQSIPILGFLAITVSVFLAMFPYSLWGAQAAVIFGIFTAQVWNMILSFYQSLKTVPKELKESADMYQLSGWQRFWKLEVPFAMPGLIWNTMMSMSAGWFMIVASESIVVNFSRHSSATINLEGIGTFINMANNNQNLMAVGAAIITMLIVVVLYNQLLFRPLVAWSQKFTVSEFQQEGDTTPWFLSLLKNSRFFQAAGRWLGACGNRIVNLPWLKRDLARNYNQPRHSRAAKPVKWWHNALWHSMLGASLVLCAWLAWQVIYNNPASNIGMVETLKVFGFGLATAARVFTLIAIASLIWVPIGVWIGMRPAVAQAVQPYVQILAAFPVNVFYGIFGTLVIAWDLNFNLWCTLLMALGTQWYILFNVIAGASAIPQELKMAASNLQLSGWRKWLKYLLPAIMPYYVTGAITAAGGAWNASIICEYINWGSGSAITATGLGAYITEQYHTMGNHTPNIVLGVVVMSLLVVLTNKLFWRRLYHYAETRFSMNL